MFDLAPAGARRGLMLGALAAALLAAPAHGQTWRTMTSARQLPAGGPVRVELEYGAGELRVRPTEGALLYRMEMRYDEEHVTPVSTFDAASRTLRLGVSGRGQKRSGSGSGEGSRASVELTRAVPLDLQLHFGAGEAELDLGGVRLQRLDVATGASETTIRFDAPNPIAAQEVSIRSGAAELKAYNLGNSGASRFSFQGGVGSTLLHFGGSWSRSATATVQMGIGEVTFRFPRDLGVRINRKSMFTSFDADDMVKQGNSYMSRNWQSAPHRLTIELEAAFGSVDVEWTN